MFQSYYCHVHDLSQPISIGKLYEKPKPYIAYTSLPIVTDWRLKICRSSSSWTPTGTLIVSHTTRFGKWDEGSEATECLVDILANSRVRVAEPQTRGRGRNISEQGVKTLAVGYIRRRKGVAAVRAQCYFLLGRIEGLGSGSLTAAGRRRKAVEMERQWR